MSRGPVDDDGGALRRRPQPPRGPHRWSRAPLWLGTLALAAVCALGVWRWNEPVRVAAADPDAVRFADHVVTVAAGLLAALTLAVLMAGSRLPLAAAGMYFAGVFVAFVGHRLAPGSVHATLLAAAAVACAVATLGALLTAARVETLGRRRETS